MAPYIASRVLTDLSLSYCSSMKYIPRMSFYDSLVGGGSEIVFLTENHLHDIRKYRGINDVPVWRIPGFFYI